MFIMDDRRLSTLHRRRLPHFVPPQTEHGLTYFVTWRLRRGVPHLASDERSCVLGAINHFDAIRYDVHAAVVMDDHVHVLFTLLANHTLSRVLHAWKSFTAHELQKLGRRGSVWQDEYFDRTIFSAAEFEQKATYIVANPAKRWPSLSGYQWVQSAVVFTELDVGGTGPNVP